jgi:hypothetical protein
MPTRKSYVRILKAAGLLDKTSTDGAYVRQGGRIDLDASTISDFIMTKTLD